MAANVIYWKGSGEVRTDLLTAMNAAGSQVAVLNNLETVLDALPQFEERPLILVDASAGDSEAATRIIELSGAESLLTYPIFFVANQATKRSSILKRQFKNFRPFDVPFRIAELLGGIDEAVQKSQNIVPDKPELVLREPTRGGAKIDTRNLDRARLINNLDPTQLVQTFGGGFFSTASDLSKFNDSLLVPKDHPKRETLFSALAEITKYNTWLGLHSRRTAFLSSAIATALNFGKERDTTIRTACLVLSWSLVNEKSRGVQTDVFLDEERRFQGILAMTLVRSADKAREKLLDQQVHRTLITMSDLLLTQQSVEEPDTIRNAQVAVAIDLIDRACWCDGKWDPFGVHRSLRKLREGTILTLDPDILSCITNILSEAATSSTSLSVLSVPPDRFGTPDPELLKAAQAEAELLFGEASHLNLSIYDLRPNMRLAKPLATLDGKLLLRANTLLTEELLSRLIQLGTIRPIQHPIAIVESSD